jgi:hypothetical protein
LWSREGRDLENAALMRAKGLVGEVGCALLAAGLLAACPSVSDPPLFLPAHPISPSAGQLSTLRRTPLNRLE